MQQVAVEPGLVDGVERGEAHRDRGELPELGHEARVRVARQPTAVDLPAEAVHLLFPDAALEEGPSVDAGRGVALEKDLVAGSAIVLAPEEVVEAGLIQRCGGRVRREVAAEAFGGRVGPQDHDRSVPAEVCAHPPLQGGVSRDRGLLLGGDGVDVRGRHRPRQTGALLLRHLELATKQIPGSGRTAEVDDVSDGLCPFLRFPRVDIGWPPDALLQCAGIHLLSPPNPLGTGGQLLVPLRQGHEELTFEGAGAG